MAACRNAGASLADRIAEYRPLAIVSILLRIKDIVEAAAISAGSDAPRFAVPFPGVGQLVRFLKEMADILPRLPRVVNPNEGVYSSVDAPPSASGF